MKASTEGTTRQRSRQEGKSYQQKKSTKGQMKKKENQMIEANPISRKRKRKGWG